MSRGLEQGANAANVSTWFLYLNAETRLGTRVDSTYGPPVITFLRFVGVMNAAVWFGGSAFHLLAVGPFFSSPATRWILGDLYAGGVGLLLWQRFYTLQYVCIAIVLLHSAAEWVYLGRGLSRLNAWLMSGLLALSLLGHLELQRAVSPAHWNRQNLKLLAEERARAERVYPLWSAVWQVTNIVLGVGAFFYAWRTLTTNVGPRFVTQTKFRTPDSHDG